MREIKFRVWDTEKKCWNDRRDIWVNLCPDGEIVWGDFDGDPNDNDGRFEIQMFTGLKDKNGKEIYEGDIVSMPTLYFESDTGYNEWVDKPSVVKISPHRGVYGVCRNGVCRRVRGEVIGNIYENPELLESK